MNEWHKSFLSNHNVKKLFNFFTLCDTEGLFQYELQGTIFISLEYTSQHALLVLDIKTGVPKLGSSQKQKHDWEPFQSFLYHKSYKLCTLQNPAQLSASRPVLGDLIVLSI